VLLSFQSQVLNLFICRKLEGIFEFGQFFFLNSFLTVFTFNLELNKTVIPTFPALKKTLKNVSNHQSTYNIDNFITYFLYLAYRKKVDNKHKHKWVLIILPLRNIFNFLYLSSIVTVSFAIYVHCYVSIQRFSCTFSLSYFWTINQ
jgi:hypothetical protein